MKSVLAPQWGQVTGWSLKTRMVENWMGMREVIWMLWLVLLGSAVVKSRVCYLLDSALASYKLARTKGLKCF